MCKNMRRFPAVSGSASPLQAPQSPSVCPTPNLPTNIVGFRGFDSSVVLILRGGIPRPTGNFPESLSQAMLVGCNVSREIGRTGHAGSARRGYTSLPYSTFNTSHKFVNQCVYIYIYICTHMIYLFKVQTTYL